jgi:hypothetical protein
MTDSIMNRYGKRAVKAASRDRKLEHFRSGGIEMGFLKLTSEQWTGRWLRFSKGSFICQLFFQNFGCLPRSLRSSCEPPRRPLSEIWWPFPLVLAC